MLLLSSFDIKQIPETKDWLCSVHFQSDLVEEYFEAHSSSKVLTSDRTLQKLRRTKLDQVRCKECYFKECYL